MHSTCNHCCGLILKKGLSRKHYSSLAYGELAERGLENPKCEDFRAKLGDVPPPDRLSGAVVARDLRLVGVPGGVWGKEASTASDGLNEVVCCPVLVVRWRLSGGPRSAPGNRHGSWPWSLTCAILLYRWAQFSPAGRQAVAPPIPPPGSATAETGSRTPAPNAGVRGRRSLIRSGRSHRKPAHQSTGAQPHRRTRCQPVWWQQSSHSAMIEISGPPAAWSSRRSLACTDSPPATRTKGWQRTSGRYLTFDADRVHYDQEGAGAGRGILLVDLPANVSNATPAGGTSRISAAIQNLFHQRSPCVIAARFGRPDLLPWGPADIYKPPGDRFGSCVHGLSI